MKWTETTSSQCRYSEVAETLWGDWDVLWEDSTSNYQGSVHFVAFKDGQFVEVQWDYGSCRGCDTWEAAELNDDQVAEEMKSNCAIYLNSSEEMQKYCKDNNSLLDFFLMMRKMGWFEQAVDK